MVFVEYMVFVKKNFFFVENMVFGKKYVFGENLYFGEKSGLVWSGVVWSGVVWSCLVTYLIDCPFLEQGRNSQSSQISNFDHYNRHPDRVFFG